jgi:hypothetical protein
MARDVRGVTRVCLESDRVTNTTLGLVRGFVDGIRLGLLSHRRLSRIDEGYYDRSELYMVWSYNRQGLWG